MTGGKKQQVSDPNTGQSDISPGPAGVPIVGIGASAGGLEAFDSFFTAMPPDSGIAFVLVAHLDPTHTSILPELIQKKTTMKVLQVADNMKIHGNHVYIIPPNKDLAIINGTLQLLEIIKQRGARLPIDSFFRSLAQDQGRKAICMILSGTGTDGTQGLRTIKGEAGMAIVQDLESARYDGMPRSAIATGLADYVLAPDKMPEQLIKYVHHAIRHQSAKPSENDATDQTSLQKILILLRSSTGHDFSLYKTNTIYRRIERRMHIHQIDDINNYVRYLQESTRERLLLFKELLIGVTSFFRDAKAFGLLKEQYLPALFENKADEYQMRVWVPGCSSGEEVYSIAIIMQECMESTGSHCNIQIFGTDIDEEAINRARGGIYPDSIAADVNPERLKKFFIQQENQYQVKKTIREMVVFAPQNIIKDPPFTKLDMLSCRNLLIYFGPQLQKKLLPLFHYSLKNDGILFLGSSETTSYASELFAAKDKKWKIFTRIPSDIIARPVLDFPTQGPAMPAKGDEAKAPGQVKDEHTLSLLKSILSQSDLPTSVVIDDQANIVYIHGRTGRFLEPAQGEVSTNILDMVRAGLKPGLISGINRVASNRQETVVRGLQVKDAGGIIDINLVLRPLPDFQTGSRGMTIVIFEPVDADEKTTVKAPQSAQKPKSDALRKLEDELQYTRENLQTTIEELETSNEELKSTNEELQSTNEELQSTNEELETSKEELQSLNEESITVNAELQSRIDGLIEANDDIKNLLDATKISTIFLDVDLAVRRFTPTVTNIFPLTDADIGRPIHHFASNLVDVDLHGHSRDVLRDLAMDETEVYDIKGKIYRMRVRPYRTISNVIDGVVVTFEEITRIKKIESQLVEMSSSFEERLLVMSKVFMDGADPIIIEDLSGKIIEANDEAISSYGWTRKELIGKTALSLVPSKNQQQVKTILDQCRNGEAMRNIEGVRCHTSGDIIPVILTYSLLTGKDGQPVAIATIAKHFPPRLKVAQDKHAKK